MMSELLPPHDEGAEEAVLGSCLIEPTAIEAISLRADDFYKAAHRDIYAAMLRLVERGQPTDFVLVCDDLERHGVIDRVGGVGYVSRLLTAVPTAAHVEHYAGVVSRTAAQRRLISTAAQIAALAAADVTDVSAMFRSAEGLIQQAEGTVAHKGEGPVLVGDILVEYLEGLTSAEDGTPAAGRIQSGFADLDRLLGGFGRGDLVVLAARPSVGKSSLALMIARHVAVRFGRGVLFYSVEMSKGQIAQRLLSAETGINSERLREGRISAEEMVRLDKAMKALSGACFWVDCQPQIGLGDLRARAKRISTGHGLDLVVVDYLGLVRGTQTYNRVQEVSEISASLKALARELDVPVLALSQLSRSIEQRADHTPLLSDLRDSGSIEQDADVVMFLAREEEQGAVSLIVAKHRNGPTGQVNLAWNPNTTRFADLTTAHS